MFRLCASLGVHLPHGGQSRPNLALALTMHLVRSRAERRHHMLMCSHIEVSLPALLAQAAELDGIRLRLSQALQPRRLGCHGSQLGLENVERSALLLQTRQYLPNRGRTCEQAACQPLAGVPS